MVSFTPPLRTSFRVGAAFLVAIFSNVLTWGAVAAPEQWEATASFDPPMGCVDDHALAAMVGAVKACVQRFSRTHEFTVVLMERRLYSTTEEVSENIAAMAVADYVGELRSANEGQPGQTLGMFEAMESTGALMSEIGADHCSLVSSFVIDRRVPGYRGEEFRIWSQSFVCARADPSDNSVQVVELRSSERFRVSTDEFKERFQFLAPMGSALEAANSLKLY